jgi:DNA polymerase-3 subunit epsilon
MKQLFVDVETGGTDAKTHALLQIAGEVRIDGVQRDTFDLKLKPFHFDVVEVSALEKNGLTHEQIQGFEEPHTVYKRLVRLLDCHVDRFDKADKFFFVGFNGTFDDDFLRAFFVKNAETEKARAYGNYYGSYFFWPSIDVAVLAAEHLKDRRHHMKNFQLPTVAKELGIEVDESRTHDAAYDIELTRRVYELVTAR